MSYDLAIMLLLKKVGVSSRAPIVVMGLLLVVVDAASACSCFRDAPGSTPWSRVAAAAIGSDAVFTGKVLAVATGVEATGDDADDIAPRRHFAFEVIRQFRGNVASKTMISTGFGMGDCGFDFKIGETYLVYADSNENQELETSICHRTRHITSAGTDLRYLRGEQPITEDLVDKQDSVQQTVLGGALCGKVSYADNRPVDEAEVRLWRVYEDGRREEEEEKSTHEGGTYCFNSLEPGRFVISAVEELPEPEDSDEGIPESFRHAPQAGAYGGLQKPAEIELSGSQELGGFDFSLEDLSGFVVKGRVGIDNEMPEADLVVLLSSSNQELFRYEQIRRLRPGGEFVFEGVPAGSYSVAVIFFDRAWQEWIAPVNQVELTGHLETLLVRLEKKPSR